MVDALIIIVIVVSVSLITISTKNLLPIYEGKKLEFEDNELKRIEEMSKINRCQKCIFEDSF